LSTSQTHEQPASEKEENKNNSPQKKKKKTETKKGARYSKTAIFG
jgi:hypothetical protein